MDWRSLSRAKRRYLRRFPRPEQPPEGFTTWDHPDRPGEVLYVPAEAVQEQAQKWLDNYDQQPQEVRDYIKQHGRPPA